jgi:DNA-binding SARP family transcriptional activator
VLTVAVLGPVELRHGGTALTVPAGKTTEVLVRLALDAGVQVSSERLIEDVWAGEAGGVARNTLQSKVSQLRRALGDPALVRGGGAGYTLMVDRGCVDALEVLRLVDSVAALRSAGNAAAARDASARALALFSGDLLPGAGDGECWRHTAPGWRRPVSG